MSDAVLVQAPKEEIKGYLKGSRPEGSFCYYRDLNGRPRSAEEGMKILFSDGSRVRGMGVIVNIEYGEFKFSPLQAVNRPHPDSPPEKGFKYVELSEDLHQVELMGVPHYFRTLDELILTLLEKRPETREDLDALCHLVWVEAQGLDLSQLGEFQERIGREEIAKIRRKWQVRELRYPPRTPEEVKKRYREYGKAYRHFDGLQDYAFSVRDFYDGELDFRPGDYFEKEEEQGSEDRLEAVKEAVINAE